MRIYTDASSRGNISGIAFVVTDARHKEVYKKGTVIQKGDNNTAELTAILFALCFIKDKTDKKLVVFTDSSYAINAIRFGVCRDTEKELVSEIKGMLFTQKAQLMWIKGHCQDGTILSYYNKRADKMSKVTRKQYEKMKRNKNKSQRQAVRNGFVTDFSLYSQSGPDLSI